MAYSHRECREMTKLLIKETETEVTLTVGIDKEVFLVLDLENSVFTASDSFMYSGDTATKMSTIAYAIPFIFAGNDTANLEIDVSLHYDGGFHIITIHNFEVY